MESFSNILFSSVIGGPSFVHSPHVPNNVKINSNFYYLSILDPNMELPELSTKDIDDLLCDSIVNRHSKDISVNFDNNNSIIPEAEQQESLIISNTCCLEPEAENLQMVSSQKTLISESVVELFSDIIDSTLKSPYEGMLLKCVVRTCNKNFPNKTDQMSHFFEEHKEKVITCSACKSIFKSRYSLNNHCLTSPNCKLKNTYRCTIIPCDKYFFNVHNLEVHISKQHNIASISCLSLSCDHKFFDSQTRDNHVKIAHCEMIFRCQHCDKVFLDRVSLEKHNYKMHRDNIVNNTSTLQLYVCQVKGCDKGFSSLSNIRRHNQQCHNKNVEVQAEDLMLFDSPSLVDLASSQGSCYSTMENTVVKIVYACPLPECSEALNDKVAFQSHFLKHFTGELPGDINSILPPDPPVPGLELHSKTFEANVDYICQREGTNLVQALDLVPDKLLESLEWLDDDNNNSSPNSCLTSALILPSTDTTSYRNLTTRNNRRRSNPYQDESTSISNKILHCSNESKINININGTRTKYKSTEQAHASTFSSSSTGNCSRTCPKINSVMVNLIKRRRVFLRERVGIMQSCDSVICQPAARQPALKKVVHQIFNGQQLPNKYEEILNVDSSEL